MRAVVFFVYRYSGATLLVSRKRKKQNLEHFTREPKRFFVAGYEFRVACKSESNSLPFFRLSVLGRYAARFSEKKETQTFLLLLILATRSEAFTHLVSISFLFAFSRNEQRSALNPSNEVYFSILLSSSACFSNSPSYTSPC